MTVNEDKRGILCLLRPEANDFWVSEPGTITILENGATRFTRPVAAGIIT